MIHVVIAYDITTDDTRAQIAALLSRHGTRAQRSVFTCAFESDEQLANTLEQARRRMNLNHDVLQAFRQCEPCRQARDDIGQAKPQLDVHYWII